MFGANKVGVLIAGAGPVGLLTALTLKRNGVDVEIFEQSWRTTIRSYALALHPATVALLDEYGLAHRVLAEGRTVESLAFFEGADRRAAVPFSAARAESPGLVVLPQAALERILEDELRAMGVKVHWNHRVARITPSADGPARVVVAKLGKESLGYVIAEDAAVVTKELDYDADVVIGADGHRSVVRQNLFIDYPEVSPADIFTVFETELFDPYPSQARVGIADGTANVVWPMANKGCRFGFQLDETDEPIEPRFKRRLLVELHDAKYRTVPKERLGELVKERMPWFEGDVRNVVWSAVIRFERRLATTYGKHNVWLAGDAAHLGNPLSGHSMNVGLLEGVELATIAGRVVRGDASIAELEAYGRRRMDTWLQLSDVGKLAEPSPECDAWVAANRERVCTSLPAAGADLSRLAGALGLVLDLSDARVA